VVSRAVARWRSSRRSLTSDRCSAWSAEALPGLPGVVDDDAAEPPHHAHEDDLDGELEAGAGDVPVGGQEHAGEGHGQTGQNGQPRHDAYAPGEADDGHGHHQADEERRAPESRGFDDGHAQGHLEKQGRAHGPAALVVADGPQGPPQGVEGEHDPGQMADRPVRWITPSATASDRVPQRRATSNGANLATTSGEAGRPWRHSGHARQARARSIHALLESIQTTPRCSSRFPPGPTCPGCHLDDWRIVTRAVALERYRAAGTSQEEQVLSQFLATAPGQITGD
jgi:hypothetical protein